VRLRGGGDHRTVLLSFNEEGEASGESKEYRSALARFVDRVLSPLFANPGVSRDYVLEKDLQFHNFSNAPPYQSFSNLLTATPLFYYDTTVHILL